MPFEVKISKDQAANLVCPARCLACGAADPDAIARVRTYSSIRKPLKEALLKSFEGDFPVCSGCKSQVTRGRVANTVLTWALIAVVGLIMIPVFSNYGDRLGGVGGMLVMVGGLAGALILKARVYVAPVDCMGWDDRLVFTFRDKSYADDFAQLNGKVAEVTLVG